MKVEMYSKEGCGYCMAAARLMMQKGIKFNVQELNVHFTREMLLEKFPDAKAFPVIVVDGMYIVVIMNLLKSSIRALLRSFSTSKGNLYNVPA